MHYSYEYLGPDCKLCMQVYEKFKIGFPYCWEYCIQLYPKVAQTGLDSAINENAAVSNDGGERHEAACNEAYNVETDLIACRALRERDDGGIDTNASLVHIVECAKDEDEYNDVNNVVINLTASVSGIHWQSSLLPHYSNHYIHLHLFLHHHLRQQHFHLLQYHHHKCIPEILVFL